MVQIITLFTFTDIIFNFKEVLHYSGYPVTLLSNTHDSVPAGGVLCPLWLPKLSAFDNAADHGGGGDEQVSGSLQEGGGDT